MMFNYNKINGISLCMNQNFNVRPGWHANNKKGFRSKFFKSQVSPRISKDCYFYFGTWLSVTKLQCGVTLMYLCNVACISLNLPGFNR